MIALRRYAGPGIVFVIGVALQFGGWQNRWIAGALIVIALVWTGIAAWPRLRGGGGRPRSRQRLALEIVEPHEELTTSPHATHAVRIRVINQGEPSEFLAQVTEATGTARDLATPWYVRWDGTGQEEAPIPGNGGSRLLELAIGAGANVVPQGQSWKPGTYRFLKPDNGEIVSQIAGIRSVVDVYKKCTVVTLRITNNVGSQIERALSMGFDNKDGVPPRVEWGDQEKIP